MTAETTTGQALELFHLDPRSSVPPFKQVHDAVIAAVRSGALLPGQRLPTVRALATHLRLAPNTVAASYRSLEAERVVEGRGRSGTFVCPDEDPIMARAREVIHEAGEHLRALGVSAHDALPLLREDYGMSTSEPAD